MNNLGGFFGIILRERDYGYSFINGKKLEEVCLHEKKNIWLRWNKKALKLETNKVAGAVNLLRKEIAEKFISLRIKKKNENGLRQLLEITYSSSVPYSKTRKGNDKHQDHR